jgi:hypothetical protein
MASKLSLEEEISCALIFYAKNRLDCFKQEEGGRISDDLKPNGLLTKTIAERVRRLTTKTKGESSDE